MRLPWEEQRTLAEMVFGGKTADGKRMGIYLTKMDGQQGRQHRRWYYTIHGHLIQEAGFFPLKQDGMDARFMFGGANSQKRLLQ